MALALAILFVGPSDAQSTDPPSSSDDLSDQVALWVEDLASSDTTVRDAAERALLARGAEILPLLPRFASSERGPVQQAVARIRDTVLAAAMGDYLAPSTVTLQGTLSAGEVLLEISEQTGNSLDAESLPEAVLEVDYENTPFWEALDEVLDDLRWEAVPGNGDGGLRLTPASLQNASRAGRASYSGVYRFEPSMVQASRSLGGEGLGRLSVDFSMAWEPRLRPVYFRFPMSECSIETDDGQLLKPVSPEATGEYSPDSSMNLACSLDFELPSRNARKIKRLQGVIVSAVAGASTALEFDRLHAVEADTTQSIANIRATLEGTDRLDEILEVSLRVQYEGGGEAMDSFRGWLTLQPAYLKLADGTQVDHIGTRTYSMSGEELGLTYLFEYTGELEACRFVYEAPGSVVEQRTPFALKDIPLP